MKAPVLAADPVGIAAACRALDQGELVGLPTETVYGLAADAGNAGAVARLYAAKGRPANHPVIVHLADAGWLEAWAARVPDYAWRLAARYWPGPLTLVLERSAGVLDAVTGGQPSVAVRVPDHPVAQALLGAYGKGLVAPSANRFGRVSPTRATHVIDELGDKVALVLQGGPCRIGLESTIVSCLAERPVVLRAGAIGRKSVADTTGLPVVIPRAPGAPGQNGEPAIPRVSGGLKRHYAPGIPAFLVSPRSWGRMTGVPGRKAAVGDARMQVSLPPGLDLAGRVAVVAVGRDWPPEVPPDWLPRDWLWRPLPRDASAYGQQLYGLLREIERTTCGAILIEQPPTSAPWRAVNDRLARACEAVI